MEHHKIWLKFADPDLAALVSDSKPPESVTISQPHDLIECSAPAQIWFEIAISFPVNVLTSILAAWIYDNLKNSPKKSGRINHEQIDFSQQSIQRLIDKEIASNKARDAQWAKEHNRPRKRTRKSK